MKGKSEQREEWSVSDEDDSDDDFYEEDYDWTDETGGDVFFFIIDVFTLTKANA